MIHSPWCASMRQSSTVRRAAFSMRHEPFRCSPTADEIAQLVDDDTVTGTSVVIEAGELRKGAALRTTVEKAQAAMALPCYPDEGRSIEALIDEEMARSGVAIAPEARAMLRLDLGGDRLASRMELEKLALYAMDKGRIEAEDVELLTGDVSANGTDDAVDAVMAGNGPAFERAYARLLTAGSAPFLVLSSAMRLLHQLQVLRATMDAQGKPPAAVVASARPPIFFGRRRLFEDALRSWSLPLIARGLERLQAAVLATRRRPELASEITRQALLGLLVDAARGRR
jgi:DNA polymerase III subunit delta